MAIPSGSGTEVLKRNSIAAQTTAWTEIDWTAEQTSPANASNGALPTNHIITILTVTWCNSNAAARDVYMKISASGRTDVTILSLQPIGTNETFTFNDRFVIHPGDKLMFYSSGTSVDILLSYIDQDWT